MQSPIKWLAPSEKNAVPYARLAAWIAAAQLAGLVGAGLFLWVHVFYYQDLHAIQYMSARAADQPPAPRPTVAVGVHTFGDFLLPFAQALVPNPWTDYARWPQPYPSGLVTLFKALTLLPYFVALPLFLIASMVSMLVPVISATRRLPASIKISAICVFVFSTAPFIIVIDRGNAQGLIVVPLYLFAIAWRERRWRGAACALVVASTLKLYPLILVVVFIAERKWKAALGTIAGTFAISLAFFASYPGSLVHTLAGFESGLRRFSAPDAFGMIRGNYSLVGMLANAAYTLRDERSPLILALLGAPWFIGGTYCFAVTILLCVRRLPFIVRLALAMTLLSQVVPISYGYSLCYVFVIVGELIRAAIVDHESERASPGIPRSLAIPLGIAVVITLVPNPFPLPGGVSSTATVLVPAAWLAVLPACVIWLARKRRKVEPVPT